MGLTAAFERHYTRHARAGRRSHAARVSAAIDVTAINAAVVALAHQIREKTITADQVPAKDVEPVQEYLLVLWLAEKLRGAR